MIQPKSVAEIPGGKKVIGKEIRSELEFAEVERLGFWPAVIDELFDGDVLTKSDMERRVMPRRTLDHRINKGERLTREESDRVVRVARIVATAETRSRGDKWLTSARTAVFDVPSAVVPKERNICLSPARPDFQAIETVDVAPFQFDPRLFETGS